MMFHKLDLVDQGVESFQGLAERGSEKFLVINLQNNRIESFDFFGTHPYLSELHLQNNRIQSFRGLTKQASLRSLDLQGCPVARHPYYRIMALLTIGLGLEIVDGLPILSHERHVAKALGKRAALAVSYGWSLDLGSHTIAEYDAIIDDFRRRRRDEFTQKHSQLLVTIKAVLTKLDGTQRLCGYDATAEFQLTDRQKTITRLARRVEQVERMLAASTSAHTVPLLSPSGCSARLAVDTGTSFSSALFSTSELALTDGMRFSQGIQFRHNLGADGADLQRVCLYIDRFVLTVVSFFSREPLVQLTLRSLHFRHVGLLTVVAESEVGAALELYFDSPPLLRTVYKALCTFSSCGVSAHSVIAPRELRRKRIQHYSQDTVTSAAVLVSSCTGTEVKPGNTARSRTERTAGLVKAASPTRRSTHQRLMGADSATGDSPALESIEDVPSLRTGFSRPGTGGCPVGFSSEPSRWSRIAISPVNDTCFPQTLGTTNDVAIFPGVTSVHGIDSESPTVGFSDLLSDPRRFHEFVGLDGDRTGTDLAAFHAGAEGDCDTPGESVSVPGKEGEAISQPGVLHVAQRDSASPFDCAEASAPPQSPSWRLEKDMISAAIPMVGAHKQDWATTVLSSRNLVFHNVKSPSTHHSVLNDSPGVGNRKWTDQYDSSSLVRGGTTGAGCEWVSTGRSVMKDSAPPVVSSRFAALLISSDSDSEK